MGQNDETSTQGNNLKDILGAYLKFWPYFILSAIFFLAIAFFYLKYSTKQYQSNASVIIKDTQTGGGISEMSALGDIDLLGSSYNTVENEIEIVKSKTLMRNAVNALKLNIFYYRNGNIKTSDIYNQTPVTLRALNDSLYDNLNSDLILSIKINNESSFSYRLADQETNKWNEHTFGSPFNVNEMDFVLLPSEVSLFEKELNEIGEDDPALISIRIKSIENAVEHFSKTLTVIKSDRRGSVLNLTHTSPVINKSNDLLNQLINEYNQDAINDKNQVSNKTLVFLEERLKEVEIDLDSTETGIRRFKDDANVTDLTAESLLNLEKSSELQDRVTIARTQTQIVKSFKNYLISTDGFNIIPAGIGIEDPVINSQITRYNDFVFDLKRLQLSATDLNPAVVNLKSELNAVQSAIETSLNNYLDKITRERDALQRELNNTSGSLSKIPQQEKTARGIERNRAVIEAIYLLLREKKEITAISLAVTAPKAKIVDRAWSTGIPVSPKNKIVYIGALIIGLILPFAYVYFRSMFYNKIESRKDLEKTLPNLTILGDVPQIDKSDSQQIQVNDRSVLAESFRIIRTNLQYKISALADNNNKASTILVTSTVKGEGKTFISFNLATTLAYSNKRVLLIGGDIRNPQLHRFFDTLTKKTKGLTNYLTDRDLTFQDIIIEKANNPTLDIILSGSIPPNPAELLMNGRVEKLLSEVEDRYDVIIIDSAPTILVTDTFLINDNADITVYVSRAGYTERSLLQYVDDTVKAKKLTNLALIINDVKMANFGYGNKYGYAYGEDKKPWYKKIF